jgi:predicted lipoprotein with Yx(FWY)xxD motif
LPTTKNKREVKLMRFHRAAIITVSGVVALSAIGVGSVAAATYAVPTKTSTPQAAALQPLARAANVAMSTTVHAGKATVDGKKETVLLNFRGLPLYYYQLDTAKKSFVSGSLAQLWPPLLSASPTEAGAKGKLTVLTDPSGHQVAYNGHFLYTFAEDSPGHVTGQGVQGFFIATPSLKVISPSSKPEATTPTTSGGYW